MIDYRQGNKIIMIQLVSWVNTVGKTTLTDDEIYEASKFMLAAIHDYKNATLFMTRLSMHSLTSAALYRTIQQCYLELYPDGKEDESKIETAIVSFGIKASSKISSIQDDTIIQSIIYRCISLFSKKSDATIFCSAMKTNVKDELYKYIDMYLEDYRYMVKPLPGYYIH